MKPEASPSDHHRRHLSDDTASSTVLLDDLDSPSTARFQAASPRGWQSSLRCPAERHTAFVELSSRQLWCNTAKNLCALTRIMFQSRFRQSRCGRLQCDGIGEFDNPQLWMWVQALVNTSWHKRSGQGQWHDAAPFAYQQVDGLTNDKRTNGSKKLLHGIALHDTAANSHKFTTRLCFRRAEPHSAS